MERMRIAPQRSRHRRITLIGAILAIGVLVVAACGSDTSDGDASVDGSTSTTVDAEAGSSSDGDGDPEPPPLVEVGPDEGGNDTGDGDPANGDDSDGTNGNGGDNSDGTNGNGSTDDFVAPPTTNAEGNTEGDGPTAQEIIEELIDDPTTEVGGEVPETPEVVEDLSIDVPCDLFTSDELGELVAGWSDQTGLTGDLPAGLLSEGSTIDFAVQTDTQTSCDWFSDAQVWLVSATWEASEPTFSAIVLSGGTPIEGVGDEAALLSDSRAAAVVEGLLVTVTNLAPGGADSPNAAAVTQLLLAEVVDRISDAA